MIEGMCMLVRLHGYVGKMKDFWKSLFKTEGSDHIKQLVLRWNWNKD